MKIAYIIFFGLINLLIFSKLTKKIKLDKNLTFGLIIAIVIVGLIQVINPFDNAIPNKEFLILLGFSISLIGVHFMSRLTIIVNNALRSGDINDLGTKGFLFITQYVFYVMIYVFQIATLLKK